MQNFTIQGVNEHALAPISGDTKAKINQSPSEEKISKKAIDVFYNSETMQELDEPGALGALKRKKVDIKSIYPELNFLKEKITNKTKEQPSRTDQQFLALEVLNRIMVDAEYATDEKTNCSHLLTAETRHGTEIKLQQGSVEAYFDENQPLDGAKTILFDVSSMPSCAIRYAQKKKMKINYKNISTNVFERPAHAQANRLLNNYEGDEKNGELWSVLGIPDDPDENNKSAICSTYAEYLNIFYENINRQNTRGEKPPLNFFVNCALGANRSSVMTMTAIYRIITADYEFCNTNTDQMFDDIHRFLQTKRRVVQIRDKHKEIIKETEFKMIIKKQVEDTIPNS